MSEQIMPFEGQAYTREVLLQTSAEWAQTPDYVLQAYQTGRETDTGREKTGTGYTVWADLPYDSPDGSPFTADGIDDLANGVPEPTDRVPIVTDITGVAATATITVGSVVSPTLLTVGSATFTLVDSIDVELPQIEIGETPAATATSIINAINDEDYAELCGCSAEIDGGDDTLINLTASATGVAGDDIILVSTDADELTVTAFSGGVDAEAVLRKVTVADLGGGGGVISVANAAARFALTGLGRLATVYQEDNGFYYQVVDPAQLGDPAGWQGLPKVYRALLSQSGTDAPTAVVIENTLGGTLVWSRLSAGLYIGTLAGAFPDKNKVLLPARSACLNAGDAPISIIPVWSTVNAINLFIVTFPSGDYSELEVNDLPFSILVYP